MAHRWGLTLGAYNKYAYIFGKELPISIIVQSGTLAQASYIRDVIRYAHENNLKGADWFGQVKVTTKDNNTIWVTPKKSAVVPDSYSSSSLLDIISMHQSAVLQNGYKTYIQDELTELDSVCEALNISYIDHGNSLVEFTVAG